MRAPGGRGRTFDVSDPEHLADFFMATMGSSNPRPWTEAEEAAVERGIARLEDRDTGEYRDALLDGWR